MCVTDPKRTEPPAAPSTAVAAVRLEFPHARCAAIPPAAASSAGARASNEARALISALIAMGWSSLDHITVRSNWSTGNAVTKASYQRM